jgi:glycosyltransferase involved in cell wall biosynthesis
MPEEPRVAIVAARNEAERIGATLDALRQALPDARLIVADDASTDSTRERALERGAWLISRRRPHGKGANVGAAADAALSEFPDETLVLLCDADLSATARELTALLDAVEVGRCDLAVGRFADPRGGGFGFTLGYAQRAVERLSGTGMATPLSGQRAMRISTLRRLLPFAAGWGLEVGMTIDALRAGVRIEEVELPLAHRATGRTPAGFLHRARQLRDIRRAARERAG